MIYFFQFERSSLRLKRLDSICYLNYILEKMALIYSILPITRTFKKNRKRSGLAGVRVIESSKQFTRNKKMGWGMNASNRHTSKLDKYTVLDTIFKLD